MSDKFEKLRSLLESEHTWPGDYTFKFIVPTDKVSFLINIFQNADVSTKASKKGSYMSVTVVKKMKNADEVIKVYESVQVIEGILTL